MTKPAGGSTASRRIVIITSRSCQSRSGAHIGQVTDLTRAQPHIGHLTDEFVRSTAHRGGQPHSDDEGPAMDDADSAKASAADPDAAGSTRRRWIVSVFGDITRTGAWSPHQRLVPVAFFGDIELDLKHVSQHAGGVTITAVAPFGNIDVMVPDGCQVDVGGFAVFGSKRISAPRVTSSGSPPVVRIHGFTLFGSMKVSRPGGPD
jgi:hypothetical protein